MVTEFRSVRPYDVGKVRGEFPLIGNDLAYLDTAATSQKPDCVIDAISDYYRTANANVHRAVHSLAAEATARYEAARTKIASFINAPSPRSIVFTRGATESINLVASAWGSEHLGSGDAVLLTEMEHHANLVPWQLLAKKTGVELRFLTFDAEGSLELDALDSLLDDGRVRLVSVVHVSNVLGTVNDLGRIIATAHGRGIPVLVDAAQSIPHLPIDVAAMECDFLVFSGHKLYGPTGIGVLYAREELLESMPPYMGGGEMIQAVWLDRAVWNDIPYKFEAGTPDIAGAVGLGVAVDYLSALGMESIRGYEAGLALYAHRAISAVPGVTVYGPANDREALVSFTIDGIHPHDIAQFLDREKIAVRAGHHCAHPLTRKLGVSATVRASFGCYTTFDEIDRLVGGLFACREFFDHGV